MSSYSETHETLRDLEIHVFDSAFVIPFLLEALKQLRRIGSFLWVPPADLVQVIGVEGKLSLHDRFAPAVVSNQLTFP